MKAYDEIRTTDGFRIEERQDGPWLIPIDKEEKPKRIPDDPGLFLVFAATKGTSAIRQFADQFGSVAGVAPISIADWDRERKGIAGLVTTWRQCDIKAVQRQVRLTQVATVLGDASTSAQLDISREDQLLARAVCGYLEELTKVPTDWNRVVLVARGLRDVVHSQLVRAVLQDLDFRPCEHCGRPFIVTPTKKDSHFCQKSCRVNVHKTRRREAVKSYLEGKSVTDIAERLDVDFDTVKHWIYEDV